MNELHKLPDLALLRRLFQNRIHPPGLVLVPLHEGDARAHALKVQEVARDVFAVVKAPALGQLLGELAEVRLDGGRPAARRKARRAG